MSRYRKKTLIKGSTDYQLGDLHAWCADHEGFPDENEPEPVFVVRLQFFYPDEESGEGDDFEAAATTNKGDQFRWFLSTRHLIAFSKLGSLCFRSTLN